MKKSRKWVGFLHDPLGLITAIAMEITVVFIIVLMVGLTAHSIARYFFSKSLLWFMEIGSYLFLGIVFLALASTQRADRHIKVDILTIHLPERSLRPLMGLVVPIICLIYVAFFLWGSLWMTWRFYRQDAVGFDLPSMPLFLPAIIIPIGLLLLAFVLVSTVIRYFRQVKPTEQPVRAEEREEKTPL